LDDWVLCRIYKKTNQNLDSSQEIREEEEQSITEDPNPQMLRDFNAQNLSNSNLFAHVNSNSDMSFTLPKSSSLANLLESFESIDHPSLSRLFDNTDLPGLELDFSTNTKLNQPFIINNNFEKEGENFVGEVYQTERPALGAQNAPKRLKMEKTSTDDSRDRSQFNLYHPLMNQNLLLNNQFGLY
jgi:hypothetical protein